MAVIRMLSVIMFKDLTIAPAKLDMLEMAKAVLVSE